MRESFPRDLRPEKVALTITRKICLIIATKTGNTFDAVIIGGGPAGASSAAIPPSMVIVCWYWKKKISALPCR